MKVIVTGGAGYVGNVLVPMLLREGHEVKVIDLLWFGNQLPGECEVIQKDIKDITDEELRWSNSIIHLAGLSNDPMAEYSPLENYISNAALTAYLAQKAKENKVEKFIFASTCSVYGFAPDRQVDEEEQPHPQFPYGISKLMAERALLTLMDTYFNVTILRKGTIGGYSPRMRYDLVINTMTKTALQDRKLVVRNTKLWRPIVDINDVAKAYCLALEANPWTSGIYNIVERNYTILQLGEAVAQVVEDTGKTKPEIEKYGRFDLRNYKASGQKARDYLDFTPKFTVRNTVKELVERISEGKCTDFNNPNYYNIEIMERRK